MNAIVLRRAELEHSADAVVIRGRRIGWNALYDRSMLETDRVEELARRFAEAEPFPHLVIDDLFNPDLLDLVHEEFDLYAATTLKQNHGDHERIFRRSGAPVLGPATQIYFALVNSEPFLAFLEAVDGGPPLIADATLRNGGLHETRRGGRFDVHLDFVADERTRLTNRLVLLTYLNRNWDETWGGHLELWTRTACAHRVAPLFGKSLLFRHTDRSYHGHPAPLAAPPDRARRSLCSYYYVNAGAGVAPLLNAEKHSHFLSEEGRLFSATRLKDAVQMILPPILWRGLRNRTLRLRG